MIPLATFAIVQNPAIARGTVHHVQAGDSLWSISRRYKTTVSELKRINGFTSDFLQIGDKIRVSEHSQADTHVNPVKNKFIRDYRTFKSINAAVKYGRENFDWHKYREFYVNWSPHGYVIDWELLAPDHSNSLATNQGQKVYTAVKGDYLWIIANKYGVTVAQLKEWNNLTSDFVQIGDKFAVTTPITAKPYKQTSKVVPATGDHVVRDNHTFTTVDQALKYARKDFDWRRHENFEVKWLGPNHYVVDWQMKPEKSMPTGAGFRSVVDVDGVDAYLKVAQEQADTATPETSPTEEAIVSRFVREEQFFANREDAKKFAKANFDPALHHNYHVNWVGPNQYIIDWELVDPIEIPVAKAESTQAVDAQQEIVSGNLEVSEHTQETSQVDGETAAEESAETDAQETAQEDEAADKDQETEDLEKASETPEFEGPRERRSLRTRSRRS